MQQYLGETHRNLHDCICEHIGYIRTQQLDKTTGKHFNLPGHSLSNMEVLVLEQVKINNLQYKKEREEYHIRKFDTFYCGMNLKP